MKRKMGAGKPLVWKHSLSSDVGERMWALLHGKQEMVFACSLQTQRKDQACYMEQARSVMGPRDRVDGRLSPFPPVVQEGFLKEVRSGLLAQSLPTSPGLGFCPVFTPMCPDSLETSVLGSCQLHTWQLPFPHIPRATLH